jgi:hypothetical protein
MKNLYEVFAEFENAPNRQEKIDILRNNKSYALECVLRGTFHPNVRYVIDEIPNYRKSDAPAGLGYTSIHQELDRAYLLEENNPRTSPDLTLNRKKVILAQMLESMEEKEAAVFAGMIMKRLPVKGLTYKLTQEAFPGLLPDVP